MDRSILGILVLCLLATAQCGKKPEAQDPEAIRRHAEGMERVLEAARAFRHEVRADDRAEQGEPESPDPEGTPTP
jgi:hypothetical protein